MCQLGLNSSSTSHTSYRLLERCQSISCRHLDHYNVHGMVYLRSSHHSGMTKFQPMNQLDERNISWMKRRSKWKDPHSTWEVINMICSESAPFVVITISCSLDAVVVSAACNWTFASKLEPINFPFRAFSRTLLTSDLNWSKVENRH